MSSGARYRKTGAADEGCEIDILENGSPVAANLIAQMLISTVFV